MFRRGSGMLFTRHGFASLRYYTTLSNIFAGLVSALTILYLLRNTGELLPSWLGFLKNASAVSVGLTFFVVLFFLGPRHGYGPLFKGELFCLHAAGPILTIVSFLISRSFPPLRSGASFSAVLPTLLYGTGYAANILKNGLGEGENTNDWYGFAVKGIRTIPAVFLIILVLTWGLALALLKLKAW